MSKITESLNEIVKEMPEKPTSYLGEPFPHKVDRIIAKLVTLYLSASADERSLFFDVAGAHFSGYLLVFAERMASIGVREKSSKRLLDGLIALIIEDGRGDIRANIMIMAPLYDASEKVGADPDNLFRTAASYSNNEVAELIRTFPERSSRNKSLRAMGYKEVDSPDGFRYEQIPWTEM